MVLLNIVEFIFIFIFYDIFFLLHVLLFAVFLSTDEKEFFFSLCFHLYEIFYFFSESCDCKFNGGLVVEYFITLLDKYNAFILCNSYSLPHSSFSPLFSSLPFFKYLDATGCTALHFAAGRGDMAMVDLLLAAGATIGNYFISPKVESSI